MSREADAAIVARDPDLPGLALLLDTEAMARRLGLAAGALRQTYLRYKPGVSCLAAYVTGDGRRFSAKAAEAGRWRDWSDHPLLRTGHLPGGLIPRRIDEGHIFLRGIEEDSRFGGGRRLLDPTRRSKALAALGFGKTARLSVLRHKPERRAVIKIEDEQGPRGLLKIAAPGPFERACASAAIAEAAGGPTVTALSDHYRALVTSWIDGAALCPDTAGHADREAMQAAGAALARMHRSGLTHPIRRNRAAERAAIDAAVDALRALDTRLHSRAEALAARIMGRLDTEAPALCLIHSDFKPDQVILAGGSARIIDWDEAAEGDPAADLGTFNARLVAQAVDGFSTDAALKAARGGFSEGYESVADRSKGIAAQTAAALIALCAEGFRSRHPDWLSRADALLDAAESEMAPALAGRAKGPFQETIAAALDGLAMERRLATALGMQPSDLSLTETRLIREKPGRRALVSYELQGPDGPMPLLGKLRAKGLDRHTLELQQALWNGGFDADAADGIAVPEPIGAVPALDLWLQRRVPGEPAAAFLQPDADPTPLGRVGAALGKLHRCGPPARRRWTLADEMAVLHRRLGETAANAPSLAADAAAILDACGAIAAGLTSSRAGPIHRDFHQDQALVDDNRVWLVDLDLYAEGDPKLDAGNFIAHVMEASIRLHGAVDALSPHAESFRSAWTASRAEYDVADLEAWMTLALARLFTIAAERPERRHAAAAIAAVCHELLTRTPVHLNTGQA
jgi:aminoglycoside phosphotransferase (APT) family kinase protein